MASKRIPKRFRKLIGRAYEQGMISGIVDAVGAYHEQAGREGRLVRIRCRSMSKEIKP